MNDVQHVYMLVSDDKFELPQIVCDSAAELGEKIGVSANAIHSAISHARKKEHRSRYVKVDLKEGD